MQCMILTTSLVTQGEDAVKKIIVRRLFQSFVELEQAIQSAKTVLSERKDAPQELLDRIRHYEEILDKQRSLATAMCGHASLGNWEEVSRHIKLINGLSFMIRDDAREIIAGATPRTQTEQAEMLMC